jgi:hypothetical protein
MRGARTRNKEHLLPSAHSFSMVCTHDFSEINKIACKLLGVYWNFGAGAATDPLVQLEREAGARDLRRVARPAVAPAPGFAPSVL